MTVSSQNKIRSLQRLLQRKGDSLSEEERRSLQEKIASLEQEKSENIAKAAKKKHESKYHMVKFFERKKIVRHVEHLLKRLRRLCGSSTTDDDELFAALNAHPVTQAEDEESIVRTVAERLPLKETETATASAEEVREVVRGYRRLRDDLLYVLYYPVDKKYVALFAGSEQSAEEAQEHGESNAQVPHSQGAVLRRCVLAGKALVASESARLAAREKHAQALARGERDLVQHAIDVQMKRKTEDEKEGKPSSNKRTRAEREGEEDEVRENKPERNEKEKEKEKEKKQHKKQKKEEKKERALSTSAAATASSSSSSAAKADSATDNEDEKKTVSASSSAPVTSIAAASTAGDGFFLEEASPDDLVAAQKARESERETRALVKHAVDRKKHNTHKKLHGHKAGGVFHKERDNSKGSYGRKKHF